LSIEVAVGGNTDSAARGFPAEVFVAKYREYCEADYARCEQLVDQAWSFTRHFQPAPFAALAKELYTRGALRGSNFAQVVEEDGRVVGFIFGLNENGPKIPSQFLSGLRFLWRLMRISGLSMSAKKQLLSAIAAHEKSRACWIPERRSEVTLFVVDAPYQGFGFGKRLIRNFLRHTCEAGVVSVYVETNKRGAAKFYENFGFAHVADFISPLHDYVTPKGRPCVYQYRCG